MSVRLFTFSTVPITAYGTYRVGISEEMLDEMCAEPSNPTEDELVKIFRDQSVESCELVDTSVLEVDEYNKENWELTTVEGEGF